MFGVMECWSAGYPQNIPFLYDPNIISYCRYGKVLKAFMEVL